MNFMYKKYLSLTTSFHDNCEDVGDEIYQCLVPILPTYAKKAEITTGIGLAYAVNSSTS